MTVDQTLRPPRANPLEDVATAILGAVEQQLSRYFTAMNQRMDAFQRETEQRFRDLADLQQRRFIELEQYVEQRVQHASGPTGIDPETLLEIRQTVRGDMERSFGEVKHRLDELAATDRRLDENGSALGLRVIGTADALAQRIEAGDQQVAQATEARLQALHREVAKALEAVTVQINDRATTLQAKLDASESRGVDRTLALEARVKDEQGRKMAELEAAVGRNSAGFDEAIIAMSRRVLDVENTLHDTEARITELAARVGTLDESVLDEFREQVDKAMGEATLVRIEMDRLVTTTQERLDRSSVRMSQIEELVSDAVDVSATVQLERLDELERQMILLAPHVPPASPNSNTHSTAASAGDGTGAYDSYGSFDADSSFTTH